MAFVAYIGDRTGTRPYVVKFDGSALSREQLHASDAGPVESVWGASLDDVWALGNGKAYHFNGTLWTRYVTGLVYPGGLYGKIHGRSSVDVWATGKSKGLAHYNGLGWSLFDTAGWPNYSYDTVYCVPGSLDIWVSMAATTNVVMHSQDGGLTWTQRAPGLAWPMVAGIHGVSADSVYFVSTAAGAVRRWNGASFSNAGAALPTGCSDIVVVADDNVWVTAYDGSRTDEVYHYNGSTWATIKTGLTPGVNTGPFALDNGDIYVAGNGAAGPVLYHYDVSADTWALVDISSVAAATFGEVWSSGADWPPPTLTPIEPVHLQVMVSLDSAIEMRLDGALSIADGWTVDVQRYAGAAWERAFTHGVGAGSGWGALLVPITGGYELTLRSARRLRPRSRVTVRVTAVDDDGQAIVLA